MYGGRERGRSLEEEGGPGSMGRGSEGGYKKGGGIERRGKEQRRGNRGSERGS
jgi:hypothetical protein